MSLDEHVHRTEKSYSLQRAQIDSAIEQLAETLEHVNLEVCEYFTFWACGNVLFSQYFYLSQMAALHKGSCCAFLNLHQHFNDAQVSVDFK